MMYGQVLHHQGREEDLVNLNVGGIQHKVERCVLLRFPNTRVGQLIQCCSDAAILELCDDYSPAEQEYYFDRSPQVFHCVLNFYRTGHFHALEELCVFCFSQEIEYWGIGELDLEACCLDWFLERKHDREQNACGRSSNATSSGEISVVGSDLWRFEGTWCSDVRKFMWQTLEDPNHSKCSKGVAAVSVLVILTSIVAMCIHSMPEFSLDEEDGEENQHLVNMGKVVQVLRLMRAFRVLKLARHSEGVRAFERGGA
ncbi:potassium voltage-gated channel subfamily S member 3-like [Sinocyclocheilus anshuiensis]|uniref:potassium voltage-gated channel subfamily S member 3-like n=1 Tax=Sinocyclocheilus anshuiensis TaxID=1608454 RepID=UPI0007BA5CFA|nr:PREDICTED: potassium voltage-gated channel subfamily S member 3-like [Sinocyclocheilus anshuiensis]